MRNKLIITEGDIRYIYRKVFNLINESMGDFYIKLSEKLGVEEGSKLEAVILSGSLSPDEAKELVDEYRDDQDSEELDRYLNIDGNEEEEDEF